MQNAWQYFGGGLDLLNEFYRKYNIYALPCGNTGTQMAGWFRKEMKEAADFNGLKMRIGGYAGRVLQKLGCVPQQVGGAELVAALEKGTIDAAKWVGPYDDEKLGLTHAAPYYHYPAWWEGGAMLHAFINLERWNALPSAYKAAVRTCCEMANTWMQSRYDAENPPALKRLLTADAKLVPFSPAIMEASLKASLDLYHEIASVNADFKKVFEAVFAYRGDQYLWWQVAEYVDDTFLIRNRTRT
jgi:TRAP-type mannitol/chloroaromatic compound transport system substrate-binding protein